MSKVITKVPNAPPIKLADARKMLDRADTVEEVAALDEKLWLYESYVRAFLPKEAREVNELRMRAKWKLGKLLAAVERAQGARSDKDLTSSGGLMKLLKAIKLNRQTAVELQRIASMPERELDAELKAAAKIDAMTTLAALLRRARPFWFKENRERKHREIAEHASDANGGGKLGPFPLIYADPPWAFETFSESGLGRGPEQHYPTMTVDEIADFKVRGVTIDELAAKDAALFLWTTAPCLRQSFSVLDAWGFEYSTHGVWIKHKMTTGYVFRGKHEVLIYAKRGKMPAPDFARPSVFEYPAGKHSAKPPEIRKIIEKMYPAFGAEHRVELFGRGAIEGWTAYGNQVVQAKT
jgi:N6-adenosine-specific RNA methylase IME4